MKKSNISMRKSGSKDSVQPPKEDNSLTVTMEPFELPDICLDRVRKLDAARLKMKAGARGNGTAPNDDGDHSMTISLSDIANNPKWPDISELSAFQPNGLPSHSRDDIPKGDNQPKQ